MHSKYGFVLTLLFLITLSTVSIPVVAYDTAELRKAFVKEEKRIARSRSKTFVLSDKRLKNYALFPYLEQSFLMKQTYLRNEKHIATFLNKYQGTPLEWPLRKKWLKYLASRSKSSRFIKYFRPTSDASLSCTYLDYRIKKEGATKSLIDQVTPLWLHKESQPKACDPIFKIWKNAGKQTPEVVLARVKLAATEGKHTLLPYLTKLLPENQKYLGQLWHRTRRDPSYIKRFKRFPLKNEEEAEILTYGLKRLIWRHPSTAVKVFEKAKKLFPFSEYQTKEITKRFAIALASKNEQGAHYWLDKVVSEDLNKSLIQWKLADRLRKGAWKTLIKDLESLPKAFADEVQWQYWLARSYEETGENALAKSLYKELAKKRHYYGFLAAGRLGQPVSLDHFPVNISAIQLNRIKNNNTGQRAFELFQLGRYTKARREWNHWMNRLDESEKLAAAQYAYDQKWYDRAIFTLSDVGYLNDINLRFPIGYNTEFEQYSKRSKINPSWAYAIARRESAFMVDAYSSAGARGLMQVLPSTAKQVNKKSVSRSQLMKPDINIRLGTAYLSYLLDRHNNNIVLATAAYNAGTHRVSRWLKKQPVTPVDIWIETIPYKETRDYVKSVMAYKQIYQLKSGNDAQLFNTLATMNIGP